MKKRVITLLLIVLAVAPLTVTEAQNARFEKGIEAGGGAGLDDNSHYSAGASLIAGCRFNNHIFLGAGAGFRYMDALHYASYGDKSYDSKFLVPVFARLKVDLIKTKVSPFIAMDAGASINVGKYKDNIKGLTLEPQIGLDIKMNEPSQRIYITFYLNMQDCEHDYIGGGTDHIDSNALTLGSKIGFSF